MKRRRFTIGIVAAAFVLLPMAVFAQQQRRPNVLFEQECATCHGNPNVERAPDPALLRRMTAQRIYDALTAGPMAVQAKDLTDLEKRRIAEYLTEQKIVAAEIADAGQMPNRCLTNQRIAEPAATASWNGWGVDLVNTRFQPERAARLAEDAVPRLKLKWAYGLPGATAVYGQPTPVGGFVFVASDTGYVYALDADSGCVHWSFHAQSGVRTAVSVGPISGRLGGYAAYFGDMRANVYAVDADTGALIWKVLVEDHPLARITGSPKLHGNRIYVPVSSWEESGAATPTYPCCTFRGSLVALDVTNGRQIWKTYTIAEVPKPTRKNSAGTQLWAPAGGAIWSSPTIDAKRNAIYVTSGNAYTSPAAKTTDSLMAFNIDTGEVLWSAQATADDAWIAACAPMNAQQQASPPAFNKSENCPDDVGPDSDFAASPILVTLPNGHDALIVGQKNGMVGARDPETQGALMWNTNVAPRAPFPQGEIVWGGAVDGQYVYYGLDSGGVVSLRLTDGQRHWFTSITPAIPERRSNSAAVTAIPGVIFSSGWDGVVRALASDDGKPLWQFNTIRDFETVNRVSAKGGSMGGPGPTLADGKLFVSSGYIGVQNGIPGNVLLMFAVE
jgi:polyvinyl alcohol dehydrogenase (cytochrome)